MTISDKALLDLIESEALTLECYSVPTGGDDADVLWRVVSYHMKAPQERIEGRGYSPREALSAAFEKLTASKRIT